jgi:hypothetical protein
MKLRILTIAILAASWLPARAVENLSTLLPEEVTIFMSMQDSYLFEKLGDHPLHKPIMASGLTKIFAPAIAKQKEEREKMEKIFKEEMGMTIEEMQKVFGGGMAMGMKMDIAKMMLGVGFVPGGDAPEIPKDLFDIVVATHFKGDEKMAEKMAATYGRMFKEMTATAAAGAPLPFAKFPEEYDASKEDYAGVKLNLWKLKKGAKSILESPSYAIFDGTLVFSMSEAGLRGAVDRAKKGAKSLVDSPRYAALAKSSKDSDVVAYFDLGSVVKSGMNAAAKEGGAGAGQALTMMRALGINKLDLIYMTADLSKGRSDMEFGLTFHDNPGIMKVIAMDGPGIVPNFIPASADSAGHGTMHFDKMLAAIEGLMKEAVPAMGDMIGQQLDEMKKQTGVDIRKDIIANIGPDIVSATEPGVEGAKKDDVEVDVEPTVLALKIKDRKALELAVTTLINKSAPDEALFEKREYQGSTINNMKGMPLGYLFTDDWLVVSMGPQTLLEKVITRMAKGGDDGLFAQPQVKAAFEGLPGGDDGSSYIDVGPTMDKLLEMLADVGSIPGLDEAVDLKDLPKSLNLPISIGMRQYLDESGLRVRMHVIEKKK